jgi:pimeloyl-ACP methyl ester carboxylesterase
VTIDVNGIELHFTTHGEGQPLLWLHGFTGCGSDWQYIFSEPPSGYRLIAPDMRGHGRSTNPSDAYSHRQCAEDMWPLLDGLGVERMKAIGVSGGGITLLHMAVMHPSRIESMVVVSAPPYFPAQARTMMRQYSEAQLPDSERQRLHRVHPREGQVERLLAHTRAFADSYDDVNFTPPLLSRIAADTLIVFGDRDPLYPVGLACELHSAIPRSYLWVVPNGGHGPVFGEAAPAFAATALAFLGGTWSVATARTP